MAQRALLGMAVAGCTTVAAAATADDIVGLWVTDSGNGAVEIAPCRQERCGVIVWIRDATTGDGRPVPDANNPSPGLRTRPVCGLQVISGLKLQPDGSWDGGRIYDPETGKTYDVAARLDGLTRLRITGYIGVKALSETLTWQRAPRTLGRCSPQS